MGYFDEHSFERDGRLYECLGVRGFKYVASAGDYLNRRQRRSNPEFRNVRNYREAVDWMARTKFMEVAHLANLIFCLAMTVWLYFRGRYSWLPLIAILNLLLNVYPILLQRYNRVRIRRIQARVRTVTR